MARKRGKAKRRLTRMDAACDHLGRMGFSRKEVRRTVDHLLKEVYLGVDAWVFLEEDSYRVVIEAMLEKQEMEQEEPPKQDYHPHEEPIRLLEACESVNESVGENSTSHECLVEGEDAKEVGSFDFSECGVHDNQISPLDTVYARNVHDQGNNGGESSVLHGWISKDEDEIVHELPPTMGKKQAIVQCSLRCHRDRKCKGQRDVKPDDNLLGLMMEDSRLLISSDLPLEFGQGKEGDLSEEQLPGGD